MHTDGQNVGKRMDSFQLCSISLGDESARYIKHTLPLPSPIGTQG